ncbi:hypothetical protein KXD40_009312 [Peronospora effusa]|nr:hypothetical protein KXD40_009312 [Peronospora effusa]
MLEAAEKDPATRETAQHLQLFLQLHESLDEHAFEILYLDYDDLTEFLASPVLKSYFELYSFLRKETPISSLYNELSKKYKGPELTKQLLAAQSNDAAKKTALMLARYQCVDWRRKDIGGDVVFERFGLNRAGTYMFDHPQWNMWIWFMRALEKKRYVNEEDLSKLVLTVLRKHYEDDDLLLWFRNVKTGKDKKLAGSLEKALEEALEGEASAPIKRQQNDGEVSAPTKRQQTDKGQ